MGVSADVALEVMANNGCAVVSNTAFDVVWWI